MIRIKTLSLPLISTLVASSIGSADAAVGLSLSSQKTYRQNSSRVDFKGGSFAIRLADGNVTSIFGCNDPNYYPPGIYINACSPGTSGFLSSGRIGGATIQRPYLVLTGLTPALVVAPKEAKKISLIAAPASTLPRPSGGFADDSASVYYNLHTTNIREYGITNYFLNRNYPEGQRSRFESDIVTGSYRYVFPRLGNPDLPAAITAVIYPMAEGQSEKNNQKIGVKFTTVNQNVWNKKGYVELSYLQPNRFKWTGITPSVAFATTDKLYFSLRALRNPKDPKNSDVIRDTSIFPAFQTVENRETRVLLANTFVNQFITPPILPSGARGIVELEIDRDFRTGGVTYDFSNRKFQIPFMVIDRYTEYTDIYLANSSKAKKDILADPDRDGFNNLTEWILGSSGSDAGSVPPTITPRAFQAVDIFGLPSRIGSYYGFNIEVKRDTVPKVSYLLQRSKDQGKTWTPFKADNDWRVGTVTTTERGVVSTQIRVRSRRMTNDLNATNRFVEPPGTLGDMYRVKVTLAK